MPTTVSASDKHSWLRLTQLFLWESKPFDSAVTRYSDHNCLSQRKHTCHLCVCVCINRISLKQQAGKISYQGSFQTQLSPLQRLIKPLCPRGDR